MTSTSLSELLLSKYGALMTTRDFAELIGSTETRISNGFANALPWTKPFVTCRIKIGRRVHFRTTCVAEVLSQLQGQSAQKITTPVRWVCVQQGTRQRGDTLWQALAQIPHALLKIKKSFEIPVDSLWIGAAEYCIAPTLHHLS